MTLYEAAGSEITIPEREVYRYLGYRGIQLDAAVSARIEQCVQNLHKECRPKGAWEAYPVTLSYEGRIADPQNGSHSCRIDLPGCSFNSADLGRNLRGCSTVALMAATIGPGVDYLIRRAEAVSMLDAAIYQAAGAAMVEAWCDDINQRIVDVMRQRSLYARPRFSPGYGDVPLALQRDFSRLLNMPASCGISLTDTLLMVPSKSVTAFIGFSEKESSCTVTGCEACENRENCEYSR